MQWRKHIQRLGLEVLVFFLVFAAIVFVATGRDSVVDSIYMGAIAALFYGGATYVLRARTISRQHDGR